MRKRVFLLSLLFCVLFTACANAGGSSSLSASESSLMESSSAESSSSSVFEDPLPDTTIPTMWDPIIFEEKSETFKIEVPLIIELANVGDTYQLEPELTGFIEPEISYLSEISDCATVSEDGLITAVGQGNVNITVIGYDAATKESTYTATMVLIDLVAGKDYDGGK